MDPVSLWIMANIHPNHYTQQQNLTNISTNCNYCGEPNSQCCCKYNQMKPSRNLADTRNADMNPNYHRSVTTSSSESTDTTGSNNNNHSNINVPVQSLFDHRWSNPSVNYPVYVNSMASNDSGNATIGSVSMDNANNKYYSSDNQVNYVQTQNTGSQELYSAFEESPQPLQAEIQSVPPSNINLPKRKPSVQTSDKTKSKKYNRIPVRQEFSHLNKPSHDSSHPSAYNDMGADMNSFFNFSNNDFSSNDLSTNDFASEFAVGAFATGDFNNDFANISDNNDNISGTENSIAYNLVPLPTNDDTTGDSTIKLQKKNKKPEFHLPLDNLNNRNVMFLKLTDLTASSPSDSSVDKYDHLKIMEPDLGLGYDHDFRNNFQDNITPSMKPPGTNTQEYFEVYNLSDTGGEDSYKNVNIDNDYEGINSGSNTDTSQTDTHKLTNRMSSSYNDRGGLTRPRLNYAQSFNSALDSKPSIGPSLNGFNFDTGVTKNIPGAYRSTSDGPPETNNDDPAPLNKKNLLVKTQQNYSHLDIQRPIFERADSNQSLNSVGSIGSATKKKRSPKGAVCSVCDKYISRDLTRHMRIHDDVGRFQCVYPKSMCNHKTGYFNRPYDYKKHLLHMHFKFDDPKGKTAHTLTDKLPLIGSCQACGARFSANDWLDSHILTNNKNQKCLYLRYETN